ncbi:variable large family protein (plasmid) [Borrelia parkeri]|uniref:variable large family protein n=1 Tax=Borrelia parkeri TaxID=141 RepID=UPI001FF41D11|nr:variable large family protein [Borrelia parkeri]UPA11380.1 variable large family protein [Borrelia parkeri]
MIKGGKFDGSDIADNDYALAVKDVALSIVTKAMGILTIAIRKTIDIGLKTVKDAMKINFYEN